jgi:hypothetical protein
LRSPLVDLAAGDEATLAAREWRRVGGEVHAHGRRIDVDARQRLLHVGIADRVADLDRVDAREHAELARADLVELDALEPARAEQLGDAEALGGTVLADAHHGCAAHQPPARHAPDDQPPEIVVVVERDRLELERAVEIDRRRAHAAHHRFQERAQVHARLREVEHRGALLRRRVHDREVELLVVGAEVDEQVEHLVDHRLGAVARAVDLVHDEQRAQAVRERLADHEARLRHHAVDRVDHEQHRVDHREHAFHFAAEVGVAGRVDEMDAHALELDARVLGVDRDPALALEVLVVHHALRRPAGWRGTRR